MAKKIFVVNYDNEEDIFSLFREGSKSKFSFDIELPQGDIVVDFGFDGQIVGLEFFNASDYLPFLKNIKNGKEIRADMKVNYGKNWAFIMYQISVPGIEPFSNTLISPYNKELVISH